MYGRIMALENLQMNGSKIKTDPATIKAEYINIATALREEILNLKDDLKIIMSIKKGKVSWTIIFCFFLCVCVFFLFFSRI